MKLRSLLSVAAVAVSLQAGAQTWVSDSVEMGAGYANDVFYDFKTGHKKAQAGNDWDIAFQINKFGDPQFNAAIRANHAKKKVAVYSLHIAVANGTDFLAVSASDTTGKTSATMQLMNVDTSWGEGAFIQNRDITDLFDYGWGKYQGPPNHDLVGDSVYLVKVNNTPYKIWIQQYISMVDTVIGYKFRVAALDNTGDTSIYVKRKDFTERLFVYYDLATRTFINREPDRNDWDIVFTQYYKNSPNGGPLMGGPMPITYTGVLQNLRCSVAKLLTTDPDTATYANKTYSNYTNTIGDNWKTPVGSPPTSYALDTATFFVHSKSTAAGIDNYFQFVFTRFDGGSTGKTVFKTKQVANLNVNDVKHNISAYAVVPNPAVNNADMMIDAKESAADVMLVVTDITGRVVQRNMINLNKGMNAFRINTTSFAPGMYIISVSNGKWKIAEKLSVQH